MSTHRIRFIGNAVLLLCIMGPRLGLAQNLSEVIPAYCAVPMGSSLAMKSVAVSQLKAANMVGGQDEVEMNGPELNGTLCPAPCDADCSHETCPRDSLRVTTLASGVKLTNGVACNVRVENSCLAIDKKCLSKPELHGALLVGKTTLDQTVLMRIDDVKTAIPLDRRIMQFIGQEPRSVLRKSLEQKLLMKKLYHRNTDVTLYQISWQYGRFDGVSGKMVWTSKSKWHSLCPGDELALVTAGQWNYLDGNHGYGGRVDSDDRKVTFACQNSSIAKCIELVGYKPWPSENTPNRTKHHEACVRALRADYCGDGTPNTKSGQSINIYDQIGVQSKFEASDAIISGIRKYFWEDEAKWSAEEAICIKGFRGKEMSDVQMGALKYVQDHCSQSRNPLIKPCLTDLGMLIGTQYNMVPLPPARTCP